MNLFEAILFKIITIIAATVLATVIICIGSAIILGAVILFNSVRDKINK
jgi:hypothetical protein